jgi:hypothetical protein
MLKSPNPRSSYSIRGLLAAAVLYFALDLSAGDRGLVDYVVIGLIVAAILWNVLQLSRKMYALGGQSAAWHVLRTTLFWIIGLGYTVWVRPEDAGTWRNWMGYAVLILAVADTIALYSKERPGSEPA